MLFKDLITGTQNRQKNAIHFWNIHNKLKYIVCPHHPAPRGHRRHCSPVLLTCLPANNTPFTVMNASQHSLKRALETVPPQSWV